MGDNRDHSERQPQLGHSPARTSFRGPPFLLYWSWDWDGGWLELVNPLTWVRLLTQETRWGRIGEGID